MQVFDVDEVFSRTIPAGIIVPDGDELGYRSKRTIVNGRKCVKYIHYFEGDVKSVRFSEPYPIIFDIIAKNKGVRLNYTGDDFGILFDLLKKCNRDHIEVVVVCSDGKDGSADVVTTEDFGVKFACGLGLSDYPEFFAVVSDNYDNIIGRKNIYMLRRPNSHVVHSCKNVWIQTHNADLLKYLTIKPIPQEDGSSDICVSCENDLINVIEAASNMIVVETDVVPELIVRYRKLSDLILGTREIVYVNKIEDRKDEDTVYVTSLWPQNCYEIPRKDKAFILDIEKVLKAIDKICKYRTKIYIPCGHRIPACLSIGQFASEKFAYQVWADMNEYTISATPITEPQISKLVPDGENLAYHFARSLSWHEHHSLDKAPIFFNETFGDNKSAI